jgi:predicted Rossmann-fold nucleotide-binding protein
MRVIVCGGRNYRNEAEIARRLGAFHARHGIECIIHGGYRGLDRLAARWGERNGIPTLAVLADWNRYGDAAGPIRNRAMLREKPDAVIAFEGGNGTADMIRQALFAGLQVFLD